MPDFANSAKFLEKFEIAELCKGVHCVDLGESSQTHIFLQNFVSIQPRTSALKFAASSNFALLVARWQGRADARGPGRAGGQPALAASREREREGERETEAKFGRTLN